MTRGARRWVAAAVVVVGTAAAAALALWALGDPPSRVHAFEVPAGTGARLDAGEELEVFTRSLDARVGDRLVIRNDDDRDHVVGPFVVAAGERVDLALDQPGRYEGVCSLHPSGEVVIVVRG